MARLKKRDHENLSDSNISKVITLLNGNQPISKKVACDMLNIAYNTTRLQRIIDDYQDKKDYRELRKKQNRGRAADSTEIREAVERFLSGDSIAEIAAGLFRSAGFVRSIIERVGVPQKQEGTYDYLPDECCAESFEDGELVWSARYSAPAIVEREVSVDYQAENLGFQDVNYEKKYGSKCYTIWVLQSHDEDGDDMWARVKTGGFYASALAYDLGKLQHLKQYGVNLQKTS
jgi:hypothetical protein